MVRSLCIMEGTNGRPGIDTSRARGWFYREVLMEAHALAEVSARQQEAGRPYLEFIRVADLSVGLYVLPAQGIDGQGPHQEDEVYHVVAGRAQITVGKRTVPVEAGSVVYVPARLPHRFHDIEEELRILVFFAPAETETTGG